MPSVTGNNFVLPTVYLSDISTNSVLPVPTMVTFTVNMTNAVGTDSSVFNPEHGRCLSEWHGYNQFGGILLV